MSALAALTLAVLSAAPSGPLPSSFALVVTNNRSLDSGRADLHYADDDGAKWAQLFADLHGAEQVLLLTDFDPESAMLFPDWAARARPPTSAELEAAVDALARRLAALKEAQRPSEVTLVFAGHGDVEKGQGFVELADRRLTARDLDEKVLSRLDADRVHLVLDSCNSYFMLNPRKPGGRRWVATPQHSLSLLEKHPNLGVLVSTSAEAVTYEWSEIQSGVFSHELRSGMRGAADADGDGRITYAELEAFIAVANRPLPNDLYRPKVFASGPGRDGAQAMVTLPEPAGLLTVSAEEARRLTVRDRLGVRVLDLHAEARSAVRLLLPKGHGPLEVWERRREEGSDRPVVRVRAVDESATLLDAVATAPPRTAARGESELFLHLFELPFGESALAGYAALPAAEKETVFGVSRRQAEQLGIHLREWAAASRDQRVTAAVISGVGAAAVGVFAGASAAQGDSAQDVALPVASAAGFAAVGVIVLALPSSAEALSQEYASMDLSTERLRAQAVLKMEAEMESEARLASRLRIVLGAVLFAASGVEVGRGVWGWANQGKPGAADLSRIGLGVAYAAAGIYGFTGFRFPIENAWKQYSESQDQGPLAPNLSLGVAPTGLTVAMSGHF
ncbi:MAG: hypothetical protein QM765_17430 [Myxococcales bacterium]